MSKSDRPSAPLIPCFSIEERARLEAKTAEGERPLLTPENLERSIPPVGAPERARVLAGIERDPRQFIRDTFYLTRAQRVQLESIPDADIDAFRALVARARVEGRPLRLGGLVALEDGSFSWRAVYTKPGGGSEERPRREPSPWRMKLGERGGELVLTMSDDAGIEHLGLERLERLERLKRPGR